MARFAQRIHRPSAPETATAVGGGGTSFLSERARALRESAGPPAIRRRLASPHPQAKLTVGAPDDAFEREANQVAEEVMRMPRPEAPAVAASPAPTSVQRLCAECEEEQNGLIFDDRDDVDINGIVQRTPAPAASGPASPGVGNPLRGLGGSGSPLPASERAFFEPRFGQGFHQVRVHHDERADRAARSLTARAFTLGSDIFFRSGEYRPGMAGGRQLLAHELTHVVQQSPRPFGAEEGLAQRSITTLGSVHDSRIQRLTISKVSGPTTGACGQRRIRWDFTLGTAAEEEGYIVQKVETHSNIKGCDQDPVSSTPARPTHTFYEAWPVAKGAKLHSAHGAAGFTDQSSRRSHPKMTGVIVDHGTVKFFTKTTTGDLGTFNRRPQSGSSGWLPGNDGGVAEAGSLPTTTATPAWWSTDAVEGPARRLASSFWDCCTTDASSPFHGSNDFEHSPT